MAKFGLWFMATVYLPFTPLLLLLWPKFATLPWWVGLPAIIVPGMAIFVFCFNKGCDSASEVSKEVSRDASNGTGEQ